MAHLVGYADKVVCTALKIDGNGYNRSMVVESTLFFTMNRKVAFALKRIFKIIDKGFATVYFLYLCLRRSVNDGSRRLRLLFDF